MWRHARGRQRRRSSDSGLEAVVSEEPRKRLKKAAASDCRSHRSTVRPRRRRGGWCAGHHDQDRDRRLRSVEGAALPTRPEPIVVRHHRRTSRIRTWTTRTLRCSTSRLRTWIGPWNGSRVTPSKRHHDCAKVIGQPSTFPDRRPDKAEAGCAVDDTSQPAVQGRMTPTKSRHNGHAPVARSDVDHPAEHTAGAEAVIRGSQVRILPERCLLAWADRMRIGARGSSVTRCHR